MATGRLGIADLSSGIDTVVYTVPSDTFTVATVSIANRTGSAITVRVAVASSASPAAGEYIEYDSTIPANAVLERTGIVLKATENIAVRSSSASVSVVCWGIETSTV